jgi:formylglycine-generating enzyme required for sulfatase activity
MAPAPIDPDDIAALRRRLAELETGQPASLTGSGALAQGGGDAVGEAGVKTADNFGTIVTGTLIVANYSARGGPLTREQIARQVAGYLGWLRARTQCIELRGIERAGGAPVVLLPLETAYVPLRARAMPRIDEVPAAPGKGGRRPDRRDGLPDVIDPAEHDSDVALNQVLGLGHRLAIIGGPGSGKTTVLMHMAWALASSLLTGAPEPARSRLGLEMAPSTLPLPIFVPLASFARYRRHLPGQTPARERTLAHFISHHLISRQADFDLPGDFFVQLLQDGRDVLLLLDGLDEVANEDERAEVRQSVEDLVGGHAAMRVLVTCRTVAYRGGRTALGAGFREVAVQPLDFEQHITPMVRQAYDCIHPRDDALRAERVADLLDGIARLEDARRARQGEEAPKLVDSPLMVRLLLIVHVNNRRLPDERADLFDKAINALLQVDYGREEGDIRELSTDWKLYRDMAQHLAFQMHQQGRDQGREIEEPALKAALRQEADFRPHIDDFLRHARQRGSVLEERNGVYRFIHLAFQEFLAARYLREVIGGAGRAAILAFLADRLDDPWWREPTLLLAGYLATHAAKSARELLGALAATGRTPDAQFSAAELAGTAVLEWPESGETLRTECARRILALLSDAGALGQSAPAVRARAGDTLARLGDPRFDPRRFYLPAADGLGFVEVPADPGFRIGTRTAHTKRISEIVGYDIGQKEINDAPSPTPGFYIARYPVTVAQFRAYCEATGVRPGDADTLGDPDSRPVRWVDWHEALAYCEWLTKALASEPVLADIAAARLVRDGSWQVTLPSELEWERAARGGLVDAVFPWGNTPDPNSANFDESEINDTSAVGCFPANGFGLYDLSGNVWEWTRSLWGRDLEKPGFAYPYRADDRRREALDAGDEVRRVVRGGSWDDHRDYARCAYRGRYPPGYRFPHLGFRVVLRAAPVSSSLSSVDSGL